MSSTPEGLVSVHPIPANFVSHFKMSLLEDLLTLYALLVQEGVAAVFSLIAMLFMERGLTYLVLRPRDFFSSDSYDNTFFDSHTILEHLWIFYLIGPTMQIIAELSNLLPTTLQPHQVLTARVKVAATLLLSPFFLAAHMALYVYFQRFLLSTPTEIQHSPDLLRVLIFLVIVFYGHLKVHVLWFHHLRFIRRSYDFYAIFNRLGGHLCLAYPVFLVGYFVQCGNAYGLAAHGVLTFVGVATGVVVSLYHTRGEEWRRLLDPFFLFPSLEVISVVGFFLGWTNCTILFAATKQRFLDPRDLSTAATQFSVTLALQVLYTAKAIVFLVRSEL